MSELGLFLSRKSVNRSDVFRKTVISITRLSELVNNAITKLRTVDLSKIDLVIYFEPCMVLRGLCEGVKLNNNFAHYE